MRLAWRGRGKGCGYFAEQPVMLILRSANLPRITARAGRARCPERPAIEALRVAPSFTSIVDATRALPLPQRSGLISEIGFGLTAWVNSKHEAFPITASVRLH
jgi:hypothetical protein